MDQDLEKKKKIHFLLFIAFLCSLAIGIILIVLSNNKLNLNEIIPSQVLFFILLIFSVIPAIILIFIIFYTELKREWVIVIYSLFFVFLLFLLIISDLLFGYREWIETLSIIFYIYGAFGAILLICVGLKNKKKKYEVAK